MKTTNIFFVTILLLAVFSNKVSAQVSSTVSVKIATTIAIAKTGDMHFGSMNRPSTAASVTLTTSNTRQSSGDITLLSQAPVASPLTFSVIGDPGMYYAITLPTSIVVSSGISSNDMVIENLMARPSSANTDQLIGVLNGGTGGNSDTFSVGGTLKLASSQAAGSYTGSCNVTVAYY
ncbi:MAG: DUF4402 domain-containing protein [Bacteroidota bacterium]